MVLEVSPLRNEDADMIREDNLAIQERRCELNADKNLGIFFDVGSGSDA
jgi:hypothetical protein